MHSSEGVPLKETHGQMGAASIGETQRARIQDERPGWSIAYIRTEFPRTEWVAQRIVSVERERVLDKYEKRDVVLVWKKETAGLITAGL